MAKRERWETKDGQIGIGPTYGEQSFNGQPVNKKEDTPETLKEKATRLIREQYGLAAEAKSKGLTSANNDVELHRALQAQEMVEFAQALGLFTEEEADELKREYWDNRDQIPWDIPDARI